MEKTLLVACGKVKLFLENDNNKPVLSYVIGGSEEFNKFNDSLIRYVANEFEVKCPKWLIDFRRAYTPEERKESGHNIYLALVKVVDVLKESSFDDLCVKAVNDLISRLELNLQLAYLTTEFVFNKE